MDPGILQPSGAEATLAKATESLAAPAPPIDETRVKRVARAIEQEFNKWSDSPYDQISADQAMELARVAIAAMGAG